VDSGLFDFWLRFGSVTGLFKPAPSPKPRQKSKILAAHRYIISVNTLLKILPPLFGVRSDDSLSIASQACSKFFAEENCKTVIDQCVTVAL
jgi:hypothetical protein